MPKSRMQYHIDAWWELREKKKYVRYINEFSYDFKRIVEAVEHIQPYSICIPAKTFHDNSNSPYIELKIFSQPLVINMSDSFMEERFVDVIKLQKVFCEIEERKGDIYDKIKYHCHIRIGDKNAVYAITKESIDMMPHEEIVRCVSHAFENYFKKGK